jgi:hypothetical protein
VSSLNETATDSRASKPLTANEQARRCAAVEVAQVSIALEGFTLSPEALMLQDRYLQGDLSLEELLASGRNIYGLG